MTSLETQIELATQNLAEISRLTEDLDDNAAKALLDWGAAIVQHTLTKLQTHPEGEKLSQTRLKALRKLLRRVNNWIADRDAFAVADHENTLDKTINVFGEATGQTFPTPDSRARKVFLHQYREANPSEFIHALRAFLAQEE